MNIEELINLFCRIGTIHIKESMRKEFKTKLDEIGAKYIEKWDGSSQCYVFMEREDRLI